MHTQSNYSCCTKHVFFFLSRRLAAFLKLHAWLTVLGSSARDPQEHFGAIKDTELNTENGGFWKKNIEFISLLFIIHIIG